MASSTVENISFSSVELSTLPFQSPAQFNLVIPLNKIPHRIVYDILRRQNLRSAAKFMQSNKKINEWMEMQQNFAAIKEHFIGEGATLYYRQVELIVGINRFNDMVELLSDKAAQVKIYKQNIAGNKEKMATIEGLLNGRFEKLWYKPVEPFSHEKYRIMMLSS